MEKGTKISVYVMLIRDHMNNTSYVHASCLNEKGKAKNNGIQNKKKKQTL